MNNIKQIPLYLIKNYINCYDNNQLLRTCKIFNQKMYKYFLLNEHFSFQYIYNEYFRENIHERIINPKYQIGLILKNTIEINFKYDVDYIIFCNSIFTNINCFNNIKYLELFECSELTELPKFNNLLFLKVFNCYKLNKINKCKKLYNVVLHNCRVIENIDNLLNIKYGILSNCFLLEDITKLTKCKELVIINNDNEIDINKLTELEKICLINTNYFKNIKNIESLKNIYVLNTLNNDIIFKTFHLMITRELKYLL